MKTELLGSALLIANEWFCFTDVINLSLYQKQNVTMVSQFWRGPMTTMAVALDGN